MRPLVDKVSLWSSPAQAATCLIGAGLVVLLAQTIWPALPALTAVAMIALGATNATIGRSLDNANLCRHLILSAVIYASLYLLFVGAVLDAAARTALGGLELPQTVDLVMSVVVMAIAGHKTVASIMHHHNSAGH